MYLKRLEVIGFKSFADRIGIDFVPGVTAVVGPNGSGKSNVTDAIRWVLGEQSAKSLRGSKMEDVIFAGSDSRKPVNFAEVTLVLDNTDGRLPLDYSEISVTRRVFRSGDSAYLLNKQVCRLKDITDLLMGSGLGKEAFSVISQGRVDEILNSKPEDRRSIFEEAAGVLKYKQRKRQAEVRLMETEDNLSRVSDILHELDGRIEPLRIQAVKAKDYLAMTEELRDADIALMAFDYRKLDQELAGLRSEAQEATGRQKSIGQQAEKQESALSGIRKTIRGLDEETEEAQRLLVEAAAESEKWEGRKLLLTEKKQNAERQILQLKEQLENGERAVAEQEQLLAQAEEQEGKLRKDQKAAADRVKALEDKLSLSPEDLEKEVESRKSLYIDLMNEQAAVRNELKNIELQSKQLEASTDRSRQQRRQLEEELAVLRAEREKAAAVYEAARLELEEKRKAYKTAENKLQKVSVEAEQQQRRLAETEQNDRQLTARLETLRDLEHDFSGFFQGVREVLIARRKNEVEGIIGAVAEMIQSDPAYAKAIETALGAASQHIIAKTEADAREAIDYLRKKRAGRATFLPLSVMKPRRIPETVLWAAEHHPSFIQPAHQLVTFDPVYRNVIENVLGNTIVARDLKGAGEIAKLLSNRYRVVTLEGDVINPGGSMTGGASKSQSSVFSRKAELEELTARQIKLKEELTAIRRSAEEQKRNMESARAETEKLRREGELLRDEEAELGAALREQEALLRTAENRFALFQAEQDNRAADKGEIGGRESAARSQLDELGSRLEELSADIERLTALKQQNEAARGEVLSRLSDEKSRLAVLQERVSQSAAAKREAARQLDKSRGFIQKAREEMGWLQEGGNAPDYSEADILHEISRWTAAKEAAQERAAHAKEKRQLQEAEQERLTESLKELQRTAGECAESIHDLEVRAARTETQMFSLTGQLAENYRLDPSDAACYELPGPEPDVRRQVRLLKQSIEELGTVNIESIAEFEQVAERHEFLKTQRDDLNEAKATLRTVIGEMDEEMTVRFDDTFHAIRTQFRSVFRELFGGGSADLVLTEPDRLLETGVEIVAQPPGKKLQNLSLLSGGERALTAIALLFASLNIRPVPFCILDEVEAALDEANVVRYSEYLKKFSEQTQFIVITHRKGTMEGADVLYGITMQESGVSKLVSVKVEERV
ncbi:chromosome segregation protein SMC [Indiicoccus explosivorum]|uniref:chromosome segregation protein SMC n=1 Tax=Indiicoccus explosivorum TaxID=1917864 RepID=UPI000B448FE8|nr:chromosome segregation protein SMC [Indiicoccus explosivorum]